MIAQRLNTGEEKCLYWLASYPKSGNTFLRILLSNYFSPTNEPIHINNISMHDQLNLRKHFEEFLGVSLDEISDELKNELRPDFSLWLSQQQKYSPSFCKVHNQFRFSGEENAVFSHGISKGIVYLIRHPADVALSYAHHMNKSVDETISIMNNEQAFIESDRNPNKLDQFVGSWSQHVLCWSNQTEAPIKILKYENIKNNTQSSLEQLLNFLDIQCDAERLRKAVRFSDLDTSQKQEENGGYKYKYPGAKSFFGRTKSDAILITPAQYAQIVENHEEVMTAFNYTTNYNSYIQQ
tara:strand:- start:401 stop:1285 length:885 start_codon:yes stop_codon:yes gene_type:complete